GSVDHGDDTGGGAGVGSGCSSQGDDSNCGGSAGGWEGGIGVGAGGGGSGGAVSCAIFCMSSKLMRGNARVSPLNASGSAVSNGMSFTGAGAAGGTAPKISLVCSG